MAELRQSAEYAAYMQRIGWEVARDEAGNFAYIKRLVPWFGVMKLQRVDVGQLNLVWLAQLAKKYRAWGVYVEGIVKNQNEADWQNLNEMFWVQRTYKGMLPTASWRIDLKRDEEQILRGMKPKCRYNLRLAQRRGLKVEITRGGEILKKPAELLKLIEIIQANAKRVGYWAVPRKWLEAQLGAFGQKAQVVWIKNNTKVEAVACFWLTEAGIYYGPNGSTAEGRKNMAPTLAIWAAIELGRRLKRSYLDFDGVSDPRQPQKRWLGYSRYKRGFGGKLVQYPKAAYLWFPNLYTKLKM